MEKYKNFFPPFEQLVTHQYKVEEAEQALEKSMNDEESLKVVISP
jgi:threonine dehydrogenase-like Zn-dependent dehydrogenase